MKKIILFLVIVQLVAMSGFAQSEPKLTIPSTPAFSILNFEPTSVMRPTTNKDLAADILNAFDKDGKLILNLGLETTPYWLQSRPKLSREQYLNPTTKQAFLQSFSLSAATVKDTASGDNKFGTGFRFKLLNGKPVESLKQAEKELSDASIIQTDISFVRSRVGIRIQSKQQAIDSIVSTMTKQGYPDAVIDELKTQAADLAGNFDESPAQIRSFLDALNNLRHEQKKPLVEKVSALTYQRKGLILEFAGATAFNSSHNNKLDKAGFWINLSNYVSPADLFTFTGRYLFQNADSSSGDLDLGLAYMKVADNYNISIEAMARWSSWEIPDLNSSNQPIKRSEKDFTYRVAVQGSYLITKDISVNLNIGKNFDSPFFGGSSFFSILGFNFSLFNKPVFN